MKASELREQSMDELKATLIGFKQEQFNLRMQVASGQNSNTARLNTVRKDIARVKTILNSKTEEGDK